MAKRAAYLATGETYHVFNRGVAKLPIFQSPKEYERFLDLLRFYQRDHGQRFSFLSLNAREEIIVKKSGELLVEIFCFCLMPNHFHLLLRQEAENGIRRFIHRISDGYSRYINLKHRRVGPLFQGNFKAVRIEDDAQLLHVSRYIHLNPYTSRLVEKLDDHPWNSYHQYVKGNKGLCTCELVLEQFENKDQYRDFVNDHADYARKLDEIKHLALD